MIQKLWKRNNSLKNRLFQLIMLGTIVSILVKLYFIPDDDLFRGKGTDSQCNAVFA